MNSYDETVLGSSVCSTLNGEMNEMKNVVNKHIENLQQQVDNLYYTANKLNKQAEGVENKIYKIVQKEMDIKKFIKEIGWNLDNLYIAPNSYTDRILQDNSRLITFTICNYEESGNINIWMSLSGLKKTITSEYRDVKDRLDYNITVKDKDDFLFTIPGYSEVKAKLIALDKAKINYKVKDKVYYVVNLDQKLNELHLSGIWKLLSDDAKKDTILNLLRHCIVEGVITGMRVNDDGDKVIYYLLNGAHITEDLFDTTIEGLLKKIICD